MPVKHKRTITINPILDEIISNQMKETHKSRSSIINEILSSYYLIELNFQSE